MVYKNEWVRPIPTTLVGVTPAVTKYIPGHWNKTCLGEGIFHQFGVDYEDLENGPGMFTTAIVEMVNGSVKNVPVELIEFIDPMRGEDEHGPAKQHKVESSNGT
jgi:hypothetical protein